LRGQTTNKDLQALEKLQQIDVRVDEESQALEEIPARLDELRKDVERVGSLLESEKERLAEMEKWHRDQEREIELQGELLAKAKNKMQQARNEREHKAAQREIETIRKATQDREEELLGLMDTIEQGRKTVKEHEEEFVSLQSHLEQEEKEARKQLDAVKKKIDKARTGREDIVKQISSPVVSLYERIQKRLGMALVEVQDDHCTGCNMQVEPQRLIELRKGTRLIQCPLCNRILFFKENGENTSD